MGRNITRTVWLGLLTAVVTLCGCSRATINKQVAEALGTQGLYENDEPVENPRMRTEREQRESKEAQEAAFLQAAEVSDLLASHYQFQEAIDYVNSLSSDEVTEPLKQDKIQEYQDRLEEMVMYSGPIPHLCFPTLIEDPKRAFGNHERSDIYYSSMLTTREFRSILQNLYDRGYVLVDIHDVVSLVTDERRVTVMEEHPIYLPEDKKPIIISQDNSNYASVVNGDGVATRLVLGDGGTVEALYTDGGGHDLTGDYEFVPIVDNFIEDHPDFSYKGAKGIVSVSGQDGIFGYSLKDESEQIGAIAQQLVKSGWTIASTGYSHSYMNGMTTDEFKDDIRKWINEVGEVTGTTDVLFYPYGAEVGYPSDELDYLLKEGFVYLCGLWNQEEYLGIEEGYIRQTRRFVDGYTLVNVPEYFNDFFIKKEIWDPER